MNRPVKTLWFCLFLILAYCRLSAAYFPAGTKEISSGYKDDTLSPRSKKLLVAGANLGLWTGSYIMLDKAWYQHYEREKFHFFNDNAEWNQMDKLGHTWTTYQVSRVAHEWWKWTGMSDTKSAILGGTFGMVYQGMIEIQDGCSSKWGFSWGDMGANLAGGTLFVAQQLAWKDQRLQIKFSYWPHAYPTDLVGRRDQLFGASVPGRILKDYNSQTYWISANLHAFFPQSKMPRWLNLSVGQSSDLMLGGRDNSWIGPNGSIKDHTNIPRIRRFYLSADVDLTRIHTRSKFLRGFFFALNMVKIPAPALEYSGREGFRFHSLYF